MSEEEETAGPPVVVVTDIACITVVCQGLVRALFRVCLKIREFTEGSLSEVDLRLEEDGSVLRKLMLQSHSEAMSLRSGPAGTVLVIEEAAAIIKICDSRALLYHVPYGTVMHIVSGKLHISVKEVECTVQASHPRCSDTVPTAPAAHSTAHSACTHSLHHTAGHIVEATVVGVVSVKDDAYLTGLCKSSDHRSTLIAPIVHIRTRTRHIVSATGHQVTEPSFHHSRLEREVDHCLLLTIVNTGEKRLIGLFLHHLHLFDKLCRNILGCQLRVIKEKCLAVDGDLGDGLTVGCDRSVSLNLHSRKLLEEFLKHIIVGSLE